MTDVSLPLDREEYIEQAHFFQVLTERLKQNLPVQELLEQAGHELLATAKLPMAIDFMLSELRLSGVMATAMARLQHYFTPYQTYLVSEAERDVGRFDFKTALAILQAEADYRAKNELTIQACFLFQFEALCRNRLRYDQGLAAIAEDPIYNDQWRDWIYIVRRQLGIVEFADLLYVRSGYYKPKEPGDHAVLFGAREGKIALANRQKDPLFLFAALQRHLGYPPVPRLEISDRSAQLLPQMMRRMEQMEQRIKLLEDEQRGGIDLQQFYGRDGKTP